MWEHHNVPQGQNWQQSSLGNIKADLFSQWYILIGIFWKIEFFPKLYLASAFVIIPFVFQNSGALDIGTRAAYVVYWYTNTYAAVQDAPLARYPTSGKIPWAHIFLSWIKSNHARQIHA